MARTMSCSRRLAVMAVLMSLPALSMAADQEKAPGAGDRQTKAAPTQTMDVQDLNMNISQHVGQRVSVAGEIEEKPGPRSLILESGGIFNDEILVIVPANAQGLKAQQLQDDADIVVTGTVRSMSVVEVERELGWDLNPEIEVELEGTRNFLVAERITRQPE
jgi:hypothetical protein